jgi:hypothetical protein
MSTRQFVMRQELARPRDPPRRRGPVRALAGPGTELLVVAALVAAVGVFHVWSRTRVVAAGYALFDLQQEHARLVAAQDQLRIELGMLTSPQALDQAARTKLSKLGLAPPDRGAVWAASPGRPKDEPGRAGVDGVVNPPRPAEPIPGRALGAAGPAPAAPPPAHPPLQASGARVALRAGQAGVRGP